jgi:hypothetical protein
MNFDYGCQTLNRYNFFLDKEDEDPSEILAQAEAAKIAVAATKDSKVAPGKAKAGAKPAVGAKPGSAKDAKDKKQPLQQKDNSAAKSEERKDSGE